MSEVPQSKRKLTNSPLKIGTHDGVFHCDEVLGTYMLQLLNPGAEIVRSRNPSDLSQCDIVIDVGGEYDHKKRLYDHHQREFNESMSTIIPGKQFKIKLSSAGLVYCHYGHQVLRHILGKNVEESLINAVFDYVYENFIQEIDGIDNGVPMFEGEPSYTITTHLSMRVGRLNKVWNSKDFNESESFKAAQKLTGSELEFRVKFAGNVWWPARKLVKESILNRHKVHLSGEIIELTHGHCPWKDHLFDVENELKLEKPIKFVIFSDSHDNWRVQAVSVNAKSFICRLFLPEVWCGLRDEDLYKTSGIEGCIFVHSTGFIGGNKTREGSLQMAIRSLEIGLRN